MKAMVPDGQGSVRRADVPDPELGVGDVLVAVEAYSVNRGETFLLEAPAGGWRPGKDIAGTVVEVGPGVVGLTHGQRVVAHPENSGWAELAAVPADRLAALPEGIDPRTAAALPLAGLTALRLLRVIGALPGRSILLTGASGGVGHYFVELAAGMGARITALCSSAARGERLLELGAGEIITDIADARGHYDIVIETIGGDVFPQAWRHLSAGGLFIWMGQASRRRPTIDFFDWSGGSNATLRKFLYSESEIPDGEDLATLVGLVARDRLHPEIGGVADWRDTASILDALRDRKIRGNAVLEVSR